MSTITITGSNTFTNFTVNAGDTVHVTASTTQTFVTSISMVGTLGNLITLDSTSAGVAATFTTSSASLNVRYCRIQDSTATGGITWMANTSVNNGGNTGWIFSGSPPNYNTSIITAVARVQQGLSVPRLIMGGKGGSSGTTYGLFKQGTSYTFNMWRSKRFAIGRPFRIQSITLPISAPVASGMLLVPVLNFDDNRNVVYGSNIDNTNYPNSETFITLQPENFSGNVKGNKNFCFELDFQGSALIAVELPITIKVELIDLNTA